MIIKVELWNLIFKWKSFSCWLFFSSSHCSLFKVHFIRKKEREEMGQLFNLIISCWHFYLLDGKIEWKWWKLKEKMNFFFSLQEIFIFNYIQLSLSFKVMWGWTYLLVKFSRVIAFILSSCEWIIWRNVEIIIVIFSLFINTFHSFLLFNYHCWI